MVVGEISANYRPRDIITIRAPNSEVEVSRRVTNDIAVVFGKLNSNIPIIPQGLLTFCQNIVLMLYALGRL